MSPPSERLLARYERFTLKHLIYEIIDDASTGENVTLCLLPTDQQRTRRDHVNC